MQMTVHHTVHDIPVAQPQEGCRTSVAGDACYEKVLWAMRTGIADNPEWYSPLTNSSSFEDFQRHLHGTSRLSDVCPEPCAAQAPEVPQSARPPAQEDQAAAPRPVSEAPAPEDCRTSAEGDACFPEVVWAMRAGIVERPEWYPSLTKDRGLPEVSWIKLRQSSRTKHCDAIFVTG